MSRTIRICVLTGLFCVLFFNVAQAQVEPRPTPTNVPGQEEPGGNNEDSEDRGTIQGMVYQDVNGDGRCIGTGIAGEGPVSNINIEFVSSDEKTTITLATGDEGLYGLYAAGQSYWAVTAKPGPEWVVTSQATLYAPIFEDSQEQTGINFCVQKTTATTGQVARVNAVLPQAGAPAATGLLILAMVGLGLIGVGLILRWRERKQNA